MATATEARVSSGWSWFLLGVISTIALVEYIFAYASTEWGTGLCLFLALGIFALTSLVRLKPEIARAAESLALVPMYILFTSSLPWFFLHQQYLLPAVYSVVLGLCLWYILSRELSLSELGLKLGGVGRYALLGLALGVPTGAAEYFILTPAPTYPTFLVKYLMRDLVYMLLFVGLAEELLFRGLIQRDLIAVIGKTRAILMASGLFAVMHLTWRSVPEIFFVAGIGLVLGYIYYRTGSLLAVIAIHGVGNVVLVSVMPYLIG